MRTIAPLLLLFITSSAALADEWTDGQTITTLRVSGVAEKTIYFEAPGGWGAISCPTAQFVYVRNNEALKEILAVGLAAKASGSIVRFTGNCQPDGYFLANYISLQ